MRESIHRLQQLGTDHLVVTAHPRREPRQPKCVIARIGRHPQRFADRVQHRRGGAAFPPLLQPCVIVRADPREHRHLLRRRPATRRPAPAATPLPAERSGRAARAETSLAHSTNHPAPPRIGRYSADAPTPRGPSADAWCGTTGSASAATCSLRAQMVSMTPGRFAPCAASATVKISDVGTPCGAWTSSIAAQPSS